MDKDQIVAYVSDNEDGPWLPITGHVVGGEVIFDEPIGRRYCQLTSDATNQMLGVKPPESDSVLVTDISVWTPS